MVFSDDPRISVLSNSVSNNPVNSISFHFKHFDVLNPRFEVKRYDELQIGAFFRYSLVKKWLTKTGPRAAVETDKFDLRFYYYPQENEFVLVDLKRSPNVDCPY